MRFSYVQAAYLLIAAIVPATLATSIATDGTFEARLDEVQSFINAYEGPSCSVSISSSILAHLCIWLLALKSRTMVQATKLFVVLTYVILRFVYQ